jgi:glycosyltransferase involved in cell wall biosynthesis
MTPHRIDVIICTYNRAECLPRLLDALGKQTAPHSSFEILVVDDGSTDGTENLCRDFAQIMPNLRYERARRNQGLARSRNLGIAVSRAPLLAFIDDDCIPARDWVERMIAALDKHLIVAGAIESPTEDFWKLCHNIAQFHPFLSSRRARKSRFIAGANMGFHRRVLESIGGFEPERMMAEDMECILRAGRAGIDVAFRPEAVVRHDPPRTGLREILHYAAKHARTTVHLRRHYRTELGIPSLVLSPAFLLFFSPVIAILTTCKIFFTDPILLRRHPETFPVVCALKLAWCVGACQGLLARKEP